MKYAKDHEREYTHQLFIDCGNIELFKESIEKNLHAIGEIGIRSLPASIALLKNYLASTAKYLLIVDNIDDKELAEQYGHLIPERSNGHVILTGRYDLSLPHRMEVGRLSAESGIALFKKVLHEENHKFFDQFDEADKKKFISVDLAGIPLAIRLAAMYFNEQSLGKSSLLSLDEYRGLLTSLNLEDMAWFADHLGNKHDLGYMKTIKEAYLPSIALIEASSPAPSGMVKDVLRFFAFFGTLQNILYPAEKDAEVLLETFFKVTHNEAYKKLNKEQFLKFFNSIMHQLAKHSLIELSLAKPETVTIPLTVKWAVQYDFLAEKVGNAKPIRDEDVKKYRESCERGWLSYGLYKYLGLHLPDEYENVKKYEMDEKTCPWFTGVCSYFNAIANPAQVESSYLSTLVSFIDFMYTYKLSRKMKDDFINQMKVWDTICTALTDNNSKMLEEMKKLPASDLYKLLSIDEEIADREMSAERAKAITHLGRLFIDSQPTTALRLLTFVLDKGFVEVHFDLGLLYWNLGLKASKENDAKNNFEKAAWHYSQRIERAGEAPEAYHNRALCHVKLNDLKTAVSDGQRAVQLAPYELVYHHNLALLHRQLNNHAESHRSKEIADNLKYLMDQAEYGTLPESYKNVIYQYFTQTEFTLEDWWGHHSMNDGGALFGRMLNRNSRIKTVRLYGCDTTDAGVRELAKSLASNKTIEKFALEYTSKLTDAGVKFFADNFKQNRTIKELSFNECATITPEAIKYLIDASPRQLKQISLIKCWYGRAAEKAQLIEQAKKKGITIITD